MKRVRSVVTGDVVYLEDEGAKLLIKAGIYEAVDDDDDLETDEREPKPRHKDRYRRRDLRAEE